MQREALKRLPSPVLPGRRSSTRSVARACVSVLLAKRESPIKFVQKHFPDDSDAEWLTRAAVSPSSTGTASQITPTLVGPFLRALAPQSAAVRLFERALKLDFTGVHQFTIPYPSAAPVPIFIAEGSPLPMAQIAFTNSTVGPTRKILIGSAVTNELELYAVENAAEIIGNVLSDQVGRNLDAAVFSAQPADTVRPAGLLNGVTPIAPDGAGVMAKDVAAIAQALVTAGANLDNMVLVAGASAATALRLTAGPQFNYPIFGTGQVADKTLIGINASAIASGYSGLPTIETTKEGAVHFEDTSPLPFATGAQGSGVLATPTKSAFQTDTIFLRCRLNCAWAALRPGAAALINDLNW